MFVVALYGLAAAGWILLLERFWRERLSERKKDGAILIRQKQHLMQRTQDVAVGIRRLEEQEAAVAAVFAVLKKAASSLNTRDILKIVRTELHTIGNMKFYFQRVSARQPSRPGTVSYQLYSESPRRLSLNFERIPGEIQTVLGIFVQQLNVCLEISSLYRYYQKLSVSDSLTGVSNKRYFLEKYESEFTRAERRSLPLSLIMLDIDDFKKYNDLHGHLFGDMVLKQVADTVKKTIRGVDTLARYGGEEFCVILPETELKNAARAAERIRMSIVAMRAKVYDEHQVAVTVSLGAASFPRNAGSAPALLEAADRCLYEAKQLGKNRVYYETAPLTFQGRGNP